MEDLKTGEIDLFVVNSALYHMGYILVDKKDLYEYSDRVREEVECAHDATRIKLCNVKCNLF